MSPWPAPLDFDRLGLDLFFAMLTKIDTNELAEGDGPPDLPFTVGWAFLVVDSNGLGCFAGAAKGLAIPALEIDVAPSPCPP